MGAEQSALLVCTQTGQPDAPLKLHNAEQFFQTYFDKMPEPKTGPVTEALLHLIMNTSQRPLYEENKSCCDKPLELDLGYKNVNEEDLSDDEQEQEREVISEGDDTMDDSSDSEVSIGSTSCNDNCDFKLVALDLKPMNLIDIDDPKMQFHNEFVIRVE